MILIADSGSTKIRWAAISHEALTPITFTSAGINPAIMTTADIQAALSSALSSNIQEVPEHIYYYGAGCATPELCTVMARLLSEASGTDLCNINVYSDMTGAARALCADEAGIVCILGTGSNSCYYDGTTVTDNVSPLGYILGDEGSGAVLGRTLLGNVFKRQLPDDIIAAFHRAYPELTVASLIENVYRRPAPNRFLASFTPFIAEHMAHPAMHAMLLDAFTAFLRRNVQLYPHAHNVPIHFTGSVAAVFASILREAIDCTEGLALGKIAADPMPGLIEYHKNKTNNPAK
ncbi:MAG: ATPase [Muribaculaceae bacterium]|nr:ATPase [Muribaculaceae bacterium]